MGAYSELDIELKYGNEPQSGSNAFWEDGDDESKIEERIPDGPVIASADLEPAAPKETTPAEPVQDEKVAEMEPQDDAKQTDTASAAEDEAAKQKAHEDAEAKRKAEFETRQAAKKAAEKEQLDRLAAMSDDEVMAASMTRVSTDTEKLTRRNMKECVAEHIQTMCIEDPAFARKVMHPSKSMIRCFQYISRKAWDYVQDELKASGIKPGPGQQTYGCDLPDDLCYQWAVDYFNDPDAKEDHEDEEKFVPKPYVGGNKANSKGSKKAKDKGKDKSASTPQKAAAKEVPKKPTETDDQFSFGDFMIPEEKAG